MAANLEKIVEDLSALTVMEAADLAKLLEEKWGVSAAAPVAAAAAGGGAAAAEEKDSFDVILASADGRVANGARPMGLRRLGWSGFSRDALDVAARRASRLKSLPPADGRWLGNRPAGSARPTGSRRRPVRPRRWRPAGAGGCGRPPATRWSACRNRRGRRDRTPARLPRSRAGRRRSRA